MPLVIARPWGERIMLARIPMIATTTRSSIMVQPRVVSLEKVCQGDDKDQSILCYI